MRSYWVDVAALVLGTVVVAGGVWGAVRLVVRLRAQVPWMDMIFRASVDVVIGGRLARRHGANEQSEPAPPGLSTLGDPDCISVESRTGPTPEVVASSEQVELEAGDGQLPE